MQYFRKIAQHDNVQLFWNMEYSRNIPEKYYNKQIFHFVESKKSYHNKKSYFCDMEYFIYATAENNSIPLPSFDKLVFEHFMGYLKSFPQQETFYIFEI